MSKVSVIITTYNDSFYLQDALICVMLSTCKDLEIIVIDDCSNDLKSIEILNNLKKKSDIVTFIQLNENKGPSYARNIAIEKANSEYILTLDADDLIGLTYIEKCLNIIESDENISPVYCDTQHMGFQNHLEVRPDWSFEVLKAGNFIVNTSMFRKSAWQKIGGYDESMYAWEDYDFWYRMAKAGYRGVRIPEPLFFYRHVKEKSRNNKINNYIELHNYILNK